MDETKKTTAVNRKEKLAAICGTRDALSTALDYIAALEAALDHCVAIGVDMRSMIGSEATVQSFLGPRGGQRNRQRSDSAG